jgi:predicted dehydrogenase
LRFVFERMTATSGSAPYAPGSVPWTFVARDPEHQRALDQALSSLASEAVGFAGFFKDVAASLAGLPNTAVTLEDGAASIALVTAIYHAARQGTRETLPILQDHPLYHGWLP